MDQAVVHAYGAILKIKIFSAKSKTLSYTEPCTYEYCYYRLPSLIAMLVEQIVHESFLLGNRESHSLFSYPYMTLLDLPENTGCRIDSYQPVPHCHLECRMKLGVYVVHSSCRVSFLSEKAVIELLHIRVLDINQSSSAKAIPYEMIIGIKVIASCRGLQVELLLHVLVIYLVDCNALCPPRIQSILKVTSDLLLFLTK